MLDEGLVSDAMSSRGDRVCVYPHLGEMGKDHVPSTGSLPLRPHAQHGLWGGSTQHANMVGHRQASTGGMAP